MAAHARVSKSPILSSPVIIGAIIILGLAVYTSSLKGQFVWDDLHLVRDNVYLRNPSHIIDIFKGDIGRGAQMEYNYYRPLQILTYMLDYALWGLNVTGYHITSVVLHVLVALCVYWLIMTLFGDRILSASASALFVVHPVHTEAVAYISGRADILAALFVLLSLTLYIKYIDGGKGRAYFLSLAAFALALLARESSLILPLLVAFYHYLFKKKFSMIRFFPFAAIALIYPAFRYMLIPRDLVPHVNAAVLQRLPGTFVAITNYMRILFLPIGLHMEYMTKVFHMSNPKAMAGLAITVLLLAYAFLSKRRHEDRVVSFSIGWFFITLLPFMNFYPINAYMAEHWLYLPSIGIFIVVSKWLYETYRHGLKIIAVAAFSAALVSCSYLTIQQNRYWKDPLTFYTRTLKYSPDSSNTCYNLALIYREMSNKEEAMRFFAKSIELDPLHVESYNNLGTMYGEGGRYEEAMRLLKHAIEIGPSHANAYNNLGNVYLITEHYDEAIQMYKKALDVDPKYSEAYYNLGVAYERAGKKEESIAAFKKASANSPSSSPSETVP